MSHKLNDLTVHIGKKITINKDELHLNLLPIKGVPDPTDDDHIVHKKYVDDEVTLLNEEDDIINARSLSCVNVLPSLYIMTDSSLPLLPPPSNSTLDGWEVKKDNNTTQKINAYFYPPKKTNGFTVNDLNALSMVLFPLKNQSLPFFNLYTVPTPEQISQGAWYGKRAVWSVVDSSSVVIDPSNQLFYQLFTYVTPINISGSANPPTNKQILSVPNYGITQVQMSVNSCVNGVKVNNINPPDTLELTDVIKYISIGTNSGATAGTLDFVLNNFAYCTKFGSFQSNMDSTSLFANSSNTQLQTSNTQLEAKITNLTSSLLSLTQSIYGPTPITDVPFNIDSSD